MKHIHGGHNVDNPVTEHFANNGGTHAGINRQRVEATVAQVAFATTATKHANAQNHTLLEHQHENAGKHRRGDTHRHIAECHLTVLDDATIRLSHGARHDANFRILKLRTHIHLHIGERRKHLLVAHQHTHIGIERHSTLSAAECLTREIGREIHDAVALMLIHQAARILHIAHIIHHAHLRRGVELTHKVAREVTTVVVDHHHLHIVRHLCVVNQRIKHRISGTKHKKENDHGLIVKRKVEFALPHPKHVDSPIDYVAKN